MPGLDQVPERTGRLVRRCLPGVIASFAGKQRDGKGPAVTSAVVMGPGTGSGSASWGRPVTMAAIVRRPVPGATVGDRAAPGVREREAPLVASTGGEGVG